MWVSMLILTASTPLLHNINDTWEIKKYRKGYYDVEIKVPSVNATNKEQLSLYRYNWDVVGLNSNVT